MTKLESFKKMMGIQKAALEKCFSDYARISPINEDIKINIISMFGKEWRDSYNKLAPRVVYNEYWQVWQIKNHDEFSSADYFHSEQEAQEALRKA